MELKGLMVKKLIYPNGEYHLGRAVPVLDEGAFYRIDGTHIFDKHKIRALSREGKRVLVEMTDKTVVLGLE